MVQAGIPRYSMEAVPSEEMVRFYIQKAEKIGVYMSLLREIQDGATEDTMSLGSLLRKTKLLASRIGVKEIGVWAERELAGYDDIKELPAYRGPFDVEVVGDGIDRAGNQYRGYPIPSLAFEEKYRGSQLFKLYFMDGVAELESIAAAKETARAPWTTDTVAGLPLLIQRGLVKLNPSINWIEIWKPIPYPTVVGVLDAIRTRLLDLSIQLGEEEPSVEREQRITDPGRVERAVNIFQTTVYAGSANIALGNRDVTQVQELPAPYDSNGLMSYLRNLGLDDEMIDGLQNALNEDAEENEDTSESGKRQGPGRRVLTWLKNVSTAAATKVGTPVATTLITQALLHHFGL